MLCDEALYQISVRSINQQQSYWRFSYF